MHYPSACFEGSRGLVLYIVFVENLFEELVKNLFCVSEFEMAFGGRRVGYRYLYSGLVVHSRMIKSNQWYSEMLFFKVEYIPLSKAEHYFVYAMQGDQGKMCVHHFE